MKENGNKDELYGARKGRRQPGGEFLMNSHDSAWKFQNIQALGRQNQCKGEFRGSVEVMQSIKAKNNFNPRSVSESNYHRFGEERVTDLLERNESNELMV